MAEANLPKWRADIEEILKKKFPGDDFAEMQNKLIALVDLVNEVEQPTGAIGKIVRMILYQASADLRPMAVASAGFQLGVAYERFNKGHKAV